MTHPDITFATQTIHNPAEPRHYMRVRPIAANVSVYEGDILLAKSNAALRLIEIGKDVYEPVVYVPKAALSDALISAGDLSTHCPLKGDAHYYKTAQDDEPIAWIYDRTLPFADVMKDHVGFYANRVTITETGHGQRSKALESR